MLLKRIWKKEEKKCILKKRKCRQVPGSITIMIRIVRSCMCLWCPLMRVRAKVSVLCMCVLCVLHGISFCCCTFHKLLKNVVDIRLAVRNAREFVSLCVCVSVCVCKCIYACLADDDDVVWSVCWWRHKQKTSDDQMHADGWHYHSQCAFAGAIVAIASSS